MKKIVFALMIAATISLVNGQTDYDIGSVIVKDNLVLIKACGTGAVSTYYVLTGSPMDDYWFTILMKMRDFTDANIKFEWDNSDDRTFEAVTFKKLTGLRLLDDGSPCN